jgi:hypothetical protein
MRLLKHAFCAVTLSLIAAASFAAPKQLVTHNQTDYESNAFVAGTIPSQHPTKAHSDGKVFWAAVRVACIGHVVNGKCPALIRVATNTDNPIDLGSVELNLDTGEITPSTLHSNGFTMIVNGPGESTLIKD